MSRYLGPLPPSRGVQRGPSTSVALQSTQLGGVHHELVALPLVHAGRAHVLVELGDLGLTSGPTDRCDGMSSRVALPALKTASSLPKVSLPSAAKGSAGATAAARHLGVGLGRDAAAGEGAAGQRHERGLDPAEVEARLLEHEPHVPRARAGRARSCSRPPGGRRPASARRRRVALLERGEDRARRVHAGQHRVVDALERGDLHEPGGVARDQDAVAVAPLAAARSSRPPGSSWRPTPPSRRPRGRDGRAGAASASAAARARRGCAWR